MNRAGRRWVVARTAAGEERASRSWAEASGRHIEAVVDCSHNPGAVAAGSTAAAMLLMMAEKSWDEKHTCWG